MEEKIREKTKFVDNVAYKNKFQFLIWVNDNVICQRYFKINGFNEDSIYTAEFYNCMNGIVESIQHDLESKSRVFMWYTNMDMPMKASGFLTEAEVEKYGKEFLYQIISERVRDEIEAPDGKIFKKEYIEYGALDKDFNTDTERPTDGEYIFKFSFLIDDTPVFEKIWDGNVYSRFVRNGVDLTNAYGGNVEKNVSSLNFGAAIVYHMQRGKINLISDFIRRICDTLSNTFTEQYVYTTSLPTYKTNYTIDKEKYEAATAQYGVIKPEVTGHIAIKEEDKKYNFLSAFEENKRYWKKKTSKKTREYFEQQYANMSPRYLEYIDKRY